MFYALYSGETIIAVSSNSTKLLWEMNRRIEGSMDFYHNNSPLGLVIYSKTADRDGHTYAVVQLRDDVVHFAYPAVYLP
jgi:hypothetical protein